MVPPPVPVYTLKGVVTDIDSGEPLEGIAVMINNKSTAVAGWDTTLYDTTGEDGIYSFTESVSPGYVTMYAKRDDYQIYSKFLVQQWSDRQFDFVLPKVVVADNYYVDFPEGFVTGMCQKDSSTMANIDTWTTVLQGDSIEYPLRKIWESSNWGGFQRISDDVTVYNNREYQGLDFDGERYVALSRPTYLSVGEDILQDDGGIYFLSPTSQAILEHDTIPVSPSRVRDISLVGDELYIAAETRLVRWNLVTGDTLIVFNPEAWYTGIMAKDSVIYTYDDDYYAGYLVIMTSEFQRLATYQVMLGHDSRVDLRGVLSRADNLNCWGIGYHLGSPRLYKIELPADTPG